MEQKTAQNPVFTHQQPAIKTIVSAILK